MTLKHKSHKTTQLGAFVKMTKEKHYCRELNDEGLTTYYYVYVQDPGSNQHKITEAQYRAIRGISEVQF